MGHKIGITIGLTYSGESLWANGIKQNALALAHLLTNSERGHEVVILNTTPIALTPDLGWDLTNPRTHQLSEFDEHLNVLIALGGALSQQQVDAWRQKGCKVIAYKCGAEYVMSAQSILFGHKLSGPPHFARNLDAIWAIPQLALTTFEFHSALHRCPVTTVPFVWNPAMLEDFCSSLPNGGLYQASASAKRISVFEPNADVLKLCLYPILAAELAFRKKPEAIEHLYVVNGHGLKCNPEFVGIMQHLDIVNSSRASFENRHTTAWFLSQYTDLVVSHQWGLPLNYLYLEVCWLGYPLIHNAQLCPDLGYYYPENKIDKAAELILQVIHSHDAEKHAYLARQRQLVARFLTTHPDNILAYDQLLDQLLKA
jgi:hypothetical protein